MGISSIACSTIHNKIYKLQELASTITQCRGRKSLENEILERLDNLDKTLRLAEKGVDDACQPLNFKR